jgi:predicted nucleic acid-binding protein
VAINVVGSSLSELILQSIPNRFLITDVALEELRSGRQNGWKHGDLTEALVSRKFLEVVSLDSKAEELFESLVIGHTSDTLEDGEAATLAYSSSCDAIALTDDRKAVRIADERSAAILVGHSVDLFAHDALKNLISREALADAVYNVFLQSRMRVFPRHEQWVFDLLGPTRCADCCSLPPSLRHPGKGKAPPERSGRTILS